ncbi:MAG TPA: hypothetical protein VE396_04270, partial [Xanthobacteraceae bacterium]|nr:hypothetical protein [Xanthobacteraceae bacterium]
KNGNSLSQEMLGRLHKSFHREGMMERHKATRALAYLVGYLAEQCDIKIKEHDKEFHWNTDATVFEAFRLALAMSLEQLRPKENKLQEHLEKAAVHETWREFLSSPDEMSKHVFRDVWSYIQDVQPISAAQARATGDFLDDPSLALEWLRESYALSDVRRDLGIKERKQ